MANLSKATRLQAHGMIQHDERSIENHTNEKIDPFRTYLNYNLVDGDPWERYCNRLDQVYCLNRKDVNTLANLSITLPKDVKIDDQQAFFESCYTFAEEKFGSENIVSAIVHLDETTPHIHIKAIPVVLDPKKGEKVSFKEKCPRNFYQNLHKDLSKHVNKDLGYEVSILNGATLDGNKTIKQLKTETLQREIDELERTVNFVRAEITPKPPQKVFRHGDMVDYDSYSTAVKAQSELNQQNKALLFEKEALKDENKRLLERIRDWEESYFGQMIVRLREEIKALQEQIQQYVDFNYYRNFYEQMIESVSRLEGEDQKWIQKNVIPQEYKKDFDESAKEEIIDIESLFIDVSNDRGIHL